jgi:hypothetical protein
MMRHLLWLDEGSGESLKSGNGSAAIRVVSSKREEVAC